MTNQELDDLLARCDGRVKVALVVAEKGISVEESKRQLEMAQGVLAKVIATEQDTQVQKQMVNGYTGRRAVLCIDGGGSKCAAVVGDFNGNLGRGISGPCNL